MSLLTDVQTAAATFIAKVAVLVTQTGYLVAIVTGPSSGADSLVDVGTRTIKTVARVLYEIVLTHTFTAAGIYSGATTYAATQAVSYGDSSYVSMQDTNLNHQPDISPLWWMLLATNGMTVDPSPPGSPNQGTRWLDATTTGVQATWIVDGAGGRWVGDRG